MLRRSVFRDVRKDGVMTRLAALSGVALIGVLLLLSACKGVQQSPYQQEMDDHYGGGKGGGY